MEASVARKELLRLRPPRSVPHRLWLTVGVWVFTLPLIVFTNVLMGETAPWAWMWPISAVVTGLALSCLLWAISSLAAPWRPMGKWLLLLSTVILFAFLQAVADYATIAYFALIYTPEATIDLKSFVWVDFTMYMPIFGMNLAGLQLVDAVERVQKHQIEAAEARTAAGEAQLSALRYQINPHFLYNTLNAISALVTRRRNVEAEAMLMELSSFLRWSLSERATQTVPLGDEFAAMEAYLKIERARFGDKLDVEMKCDDALLEAQVPSFILQPLIENSIKHAVAPATSPVTLSVIGEEVEGRLVVTVRDTGEGALGASGLGIGLRNVHTRLRLLYGFGGKLRIVATPTGYTATVSIPLSYI